MLLSTLAFRGSEIGYRTYRPYINLRKEEPFFLDLCKTDDDKTFQKWLKNKKNKMRILHAVTQKNNETFLMIAAKNGPWGQGCPKIVKTLLEHNAEIDAVNKWKKTPLMYVLKNNAIKNLRALLDHNAKIDVSDESGFTPLMLSSMTGNDHSEALKMLLEYPDTIDTIDKQDNEGRTALLLTLDSLSWVPKTKFQKNRQLKLIAKGKEFAYILLKAGANPTIQANSY